MRVSPYFEAPHMTLALKLTPLPNIQPGDERVQAGSHCTAGNSLEPQTTEK